MKLTTNATDRTKLINASEKAKRLCKLYNCGLIDLLIMSIDSQAEKKQIELLKNKN
jgi:hypothetical protein